MTGNDRSEPGKEHVRRVFARRLRESRIHKGFPTARSLANALGIDENRYTRYERAEVEPDLALIARICDALSITPNDLILPLAEVRGTHFQATAASFGGVALAGAAHGTPGDAARSAGAPNASEGLAWRLGSLVAQTRMGLAGSPVHADGEGLNFLQSATALFQDLRQSPFNAIADIVKDPAVLRASAEIQKQIKALCIEFAESRLSE